MPSLSALLPTVDHRDCYSDPSGRARRRVARVIDDARRDIGFLVVKEHQVTSAFLKDAFERFRIGPFDFPDDEYHASQLKGWFVGNVWPQNLPSLRPALQAYYRAMERLAGDLMRPFAEALDLTSECFNLYIECHISSLCLNHYPPRTSTPAPRQLRAGAHTDYGSLTIVAPMAAPGRLEVLSRSSTWEEVEPPRGHFIVKIGDPMAQWANDRWVSTLHRDGNPPAAQGSRRLSLVFFHQPNDDALIECIPTCLAPGEQPRSAPVTSGEHLRLKVSRHFTPARQV